MDQVEAPKKRTSVGGVILAVVAFGISVPVLTTATKLIIFFAVITPFGVSSEYSEDVEAIGSIVGFIGAFFIGRLVYLKIAK